MYDAYISLGNNCEAGLNFRRIGYEISSFFRFTSCGYAPMLKLIEGDFAGAYEKENLVPVTDRMVRDMGTGVVHHSLLRSHLLNGTRVFSQDYDFDEVYAKEYSKICYLIQKWRDMVASDQKVLYIYKHPQGISRESAEKLLSAVRSQGSHNKVRLDSAQSSFHPCDLLCLQLEAHQEPEWPVAGLFNRYIPKFAPNNRAQGYDVAAWDRLFAEFPLNDTAPKGKQGKNKKRFDFES